jgi:preprotein translocase subunit SecG
VAFPVVLAFGQALFGFLLTIMAIYMILLVLIQRGRGGGLAGALGGVGGSSAFGSKAGDVFTKITYWSACIWILLCIAASRWGASSGSPLDVPGGGGNGAAVSTDEDADADEGVDGEAAADDESDGAAADDAGAEATDESDAGAGSGAIGADDEAAAEDAPADE